jgi:glutamate-1-semialdehyde 2,1-aminomutase
VSGNAKLFQQAQHCLVGGVNSPVRAFGAMDETPRFIHSGQGALIKDCTGKEYIDYVGAWGPAILGHSHPDVIDALRTQLSYGIGFGAPHELETDLANSLCDTFTGIEKIRFTCSGTEAVMTAIRLARGCTGRNGVIKFTGGYHGHADVMLVSAGSGALSLGQASSAGVPDSVVQHTMCAEYNNLDSVAQTFKEHPTGIACVIVEPIAGNMGCVLPDKAFLAGLKDLCAQHGAMLIFDEVMTGFRVCYGGAGAYYGVHPDLTVLGKVIGGGMPVAAVGGQSETMSMLAPLGTVYQAGTLSGNPLAMSAGVATLKALKSPGFYDKLSEQGSALRTGLIDIAAKADVPMAISHIGGMLGLFFGTERLPRNYHEVVACDQQAFKRFFKAMLGEGVYLPPSAYESCFLSGAHDANIIDRTLSAAARALRASSP